MLVSIVCPGMKDANYFKTFLKDAHNRKERMRNLLRDPVFLPKTLGDQTKVMPLKEAVGKFIKPGMLIHTGQTCIRWCSAIYYEIARQFWGKKNSCLSLVGISQNFPQAVLVHGGIVNKMITSYFGDPYIVPSPNRVFQRAVKEGRLEIEHWSIYTIPLRLQAAALGVPFLPTHSLVGSSMETDNKKDITVIDDPDNPGKKIALVKALQPDISVIHGWMADPDGNAVFLTPMADNVYGALASKKGVVLTVEKIVPTEILRKYSNLVGLPGTYVKSVTEVPFGAHPSGLSKVGLNEVEVYGEDYPFVEEVHQASKSVEAFQEWIEKWVLSCSDHGDYLSKLGQDRILRLKGQSNAESWKTNYTGADKIVVDPKYSSVEMAMVAMARVLIRKVKEKKYHTLLAGAGIANLASWLAYYMLKKDGCTINLMAEIGMYGYDPCPTEPVLFNTSNFTTCKVTTDIPGIMGLFVGGKNANCIGALGAGQVDEKGNVNTTKSGERSVMVGSGGANDVCNAADDVVIILPQATGRLVESVYYITSQGARIRTVITTLGVFEKINSDARFTLTGYFVSDNASKDECIDKIRETSSWSFDISDHLKEIAPPSEKEIKMLRIFDPERIFLGSIPE